MPKRLKLLTGILVLFLLHPDLISGQNSATASFTATATIIEPIEIHTISHMNFASIDARKGGSVILKPDNTRMGNGDVLLDDASEVSAAAFEIKGQKGYSFDISLPEKNYRLASGPHIIRIKNFTSDFNSGFLSSGSTIIKLGATLEIAPQQQPGTYTSTTPIEITVNYN